jgi:hypothetical protein
LTLPSAWTFVTPFELNRAGVQWSPPSVERMTSTSDSGWARMKHSWLA